MTDTTDKKLIALRVLAKEWQSSLSLSRSSAHLADRSATSLLLHAMMSKQLVKKNNNGYFSITEKGREYLAEHDEALPVPEVEEEEAVKTTEELLAEELKEEAPLISGTVDVSEVDWVQNSFSEVTEPATEEELEMSENAWPLIAGLIKNMPEKTSFVIENNSASIVFAKSRFSLQKEGDIEAVLRAAELYAGKAA